MSEEAIETVSAENPTAKAFMLTSAFWFAVATTFGMIGATYLIAPDFVANIEFIHFGRIRPMHVNGVLFGFVTPGLLAAAFYYFPKLLRTELYSHKLGVFSAIFWNITVAAGVIGVATGHTQGREYAELAWPVDIMVVISFSMVVFNILMTVRQRNQLREMAKTPNTGRQMQQFLMQKQQGMPGQMGPQGQMGGQGPGQMQHGGGRAGKGGRR